MSADGTVNGRKSHNPKVFDSKESHLKQREFAVWPQIPTGVLQPTFIGPGRARVAVNDGFRSFPGSESQAGVLGHLSEIASVRSTKRCFLAPAVGILRF